MGWKGGFLMTLARIDEARLETDTPYRFGYVADFMGFGPDDVAAIHAAAPLLAFTKLLWIQNDLITRHYQAA